MQMDQEFVDDLDALMQRHGVSARALRHWFVQGMEAAGERVPAYNPRAYHSADHVPVHHAQARDVSFQTPRRGHIPPTLPLPPMGAAPLIRADDPAAAAIAALLEAYEPVRLERRRVDGWTALAQRQFLVALAKGQPVDAAARAAGLGERAAYKLRSHPNGRRFAQAWEQALDIAHSIACSSIALRRTPAAVADTLAGSQPLS